MRGPGEAWGTRQSGLPRMKLADFARDADVLEDARDEARTMVAADPDLLSPAHARCATRCSPTTANLSRWPGRMKDALMTVSCPHCSEPVVAARAAARSRRCPREVSGLRPPIRGQSRSRSRPPRPAAAVTQERQALGALAARAPALADAAARGRLFAEHGAEILDALDRFTRARPEADVDAFHRALSECLGVALPPPLEPSPGPPRDPRATAARAQHRSAGTGSGIRSDKAAWASCTRPRTRRSGAASRSR